MKRAAEQSDALRRVFRARVQLNYTTEKVVAMHESACNERTGDRNYGRSPVGRSVELEYSMKRSGRWLPCAPHLPRCYYCWGSSCREMCCRCEALVIMLIAGSGIESVGFLVLIMMNESR
jgi:hypothetical protein